MSGPVHRLHLLCFSDRNRQVAWGDVHEGRQKFIILLNLLDQLAISMGFLVTTLIFVVVGIIASLCTRICCNRGPSTNLLHLTLVITATVCCWMMWAIVYLAQMKPLIVPVLSEGE